MAILGQKTSYIWAKPLDLWASVGENIWGRDLSPLNKTGKERQGQRVRELSRMSFDKTLCNFTAFSHFRHKPDCQILFSVFILDVFNRK